jgi:hypothetical protein
MERGHYFYDTSETEKICTSVVAHSLPARPSDERQAGGKHCSLVSKHGVVWGSELYECATEETS